MNFMANGTTACVPATSLPQHKVYKLFLLESLSKEAGAEGLSFELLSRNVDQPFKYVATWLINEWSKIWLHVTRCFIKHRVI